MLLKSDEDEVCLAAEAVESMAAGAGFSAERVDDIRTAVLECLSNAMSHAHKRRAELLIGLRAVLAGSSLLVEVRDQGPGPPSLPPEPDLERKLAGMEHPRGWGIHLMRILASEVEFVVSAEGHTARLRFDPERPDEPVAARIRRDGEPSGSPPLPNVE